MAQVSQVHVSDLHSWKAFHSVVSSRGGGGGLPYETNGDARRLA